jgi:hypothetical protein
VKVRVKPPCLDQKSVTVSVDANNDVLPHFFSPTLSLVPMAKSLEKSFQKEMREIQKDQAALLERARVAGLNDFAEDFEKSINGNWVILFDEFIFFCSCN